MIYLEKGQPVLDKPSLVVYDQSGYYNDGDPVLCAVSSTPDEPACRFEAKYIAYGAMVYTIANPDELLEEIKKTDPKTLFGKDSQQVAVDKAVSEIVPNESGVTDIPTSEAVITDDPVIDTAMPDILEEEVLPELSSDVMSPDITVPTSTPVTIGVSEGDMSSTTPAIDTATTTSPAPLPTLEQSAEIVP